MNIHIDELPPKVKLNQYVAIDTEWFGLDEHTLHRPTSGKFAALSICIDPPDVYVITKEEDVPAALERMENGIWLIHQATFDIAQLRRFAPIPPRKRIIDTISMERILWNGYYDFYALNHLARRYLKIYLDKTARDYFTKATELNEEAIEYAAKDALILRQIWDEQRKYITQDDMRVWKEVDRPAMWAVLDFRGFRINVDRWKELAKINKQRSLDIDANLGFNPRSPKQTKAILRKSGFKSLKNTQESTILKWIRNLPTSEAALVATQVLESRKYSTRASRYGLNFIKHHLEDDEGVKVIHADFRVTGAETGRMSCSDPNMQNIPSRDTKEYRECFLARPGHKLVIADYAQQEIAIAAYISGDKKMIELVNSGEDIYIGMAKIVYNIDITKEDPRRAEMKAVALGIDYGLTAYGLGERLNIDEMAADKIIQQVMRKFPGLAKWLDKQSKKTKLTKTVIGRRAYLNPYSNQCGRNALNNPVQGTAADMMKKALGRVHQDWPFDFPFGVVAVVHDEMVLDVPEEYADAVGEFVSQMMVDVGNEMCPGIQFRADVHIGDTWAEK